MNINKIYNLDVFDFFDNVDNASIDLIVTDPPYNLKKAKWDTFKSNESFFNWTYDWIDKAIDKLKPNGSLYIFNTPFNSSFIFQYLLSRGMVFQNWITWDKRDGMGAAKRKFSNGQETILFFTKSKNHTFNFDDIRVPYDSTNRIAHAAQKGILKNGKRWYPNEKGKLCGEVWHFSSQRHKEKINGKTMKLPHLTPKPHDMIERIIKASSNKNDIVMDCFMGSGTTAIVAKKLDRVYIGCEKDETYYNLSLERLTNLYE
ncbi:MAG: site-specific DNA-methyltransferase [Campylobacteraceae bacterium 4484_166]|nr:MAG: site-specific DNA-methyltransferase [Campylobacteraceae bacterium 4484_166]